MNSLKLLKWKYMPGIDRRFSLFWSGNSMRGGQVCPDMSTLRPDFCSRKYWLVLGLVGMAMVVGRPGKNALVSAGQPSSSNHVQVWPGASQQNAFPWRGAWVGLSKIMRLFYLLPCTWFIRVLYYITAETHSGILCQILSLD